MDAMFKRLDCDAEWEWFDGRVGTALTKNTTGIVVYDQDDGEIQAVAVFDSWTENSVQMHMAIDNPMVLRHGLLQEIARYVFVAAKRGVILAVVPGDNKKAIKLNTHIGMDIVCEIADGFKQGIDSILLELRKENCKWLPEADGGTMQVGA